MNYLDLDIRQGVISRIIFGHAGREMDTRLVLKIMNARNKYRKLLKPYYTDLEEARKGFVTDRHRDLIQFNQAWDEEGKTAAEKAGHVADLAELARLEKTFRARNDAYQKEAREKEIEEPFEEVKFTEAEYERIVEVNSQNNSDLPGGLVPAGALLQDFYEYFVI